MHSQLLPLQPFIEEWRSIPRAELESAFNCPFLLVRPPNGEAEAGEWEPTQLHRRPGHGLAEREDDTGLLLLPIRKRASANMFQMMVTFGRAPTNDLCLPFPTISKFHGYFTLTNGAKIQDGRSRYGTRVDGALLDPDGPARTLVGGEEIQLARLRCEFLTLTGVADLVRG